MSNGLRPGVLRIASLALLVALTPTVARADDTPPLTRIDFAKVVKNAIGGGTVSRQTQTSTVSRQKKSNQKLMWILIGAGGAAGAALLAAGHGGGTPSTPAEPAGTITLGAPSIGGPQ